MSEKLVAPFPYITPEQVAEYLAAAIECINDLDEPSDLPDTPTLQEETLKIDPTQRLEIPTQSGNTIHWEMPDGQRFKITVEKE